MISGERHSGVVRETEVTVPAGYVVPQSNPAYGWEYRREGATYNRLEIRMYGRTHGITATEWAGFRLLQYKHDGTIKDITTGHDEKSIFGTTTDWGIFAVMAPLHVFDKVAPLVRVSPNGYHRNGALYISPSKPVILHTIDLSSHSRVLAGVASTYYLLDTSPADSKEVPLLYSEPIKLSKGTHTLRAWAVDNAGNRSVEVVARVLVDTDPPVSALAINGAKIKPGSVVHAAPTDIISLVTKDLSSNGIASGVSTTVFLINISIKDCDSSKWRGGLDGDGTCDNRTYSKPLMLPEGENIIYFYSNDNGGNKERLKSVRFIVAEKPSPSKTGGILRQAPKDYKSFLEYVAAEQASAKTSPLTINADPVKDTFKKLGLDLFLAPDWATDKERSRTAIISPDKKNILVTDRSSWSMSIYSLQGDLIRKLPFPKTTDRNSGGFSYCDNRLFDFKLNGFDYGGDGFDVYDLSGKLIKSVPAEWAERTHAFSNDQKHVAIVAESLHSESGYILFYDLDGNKLWALETVMGMDEQIQFSLDDKFMAVKFPDYRTSSRKKPEAGKLYLLRTRDGKLLSEEQYND